jgi:pimeloyl-ACP methyl ester carboxylesterase
MSLSAAGFAVRTAGVVSPEWGAAAALPLFGRVGRPRPVAADAVPTMWQAHRSTVQIAGLARAGADVVVYDWGRGDSVIALAHGWSGRASQFATLVRELVADGFRVVAFDAPAHGETPGRGTYLVDWIHILTALQARFGHLHAVVGHSFGGLAALVAAGDGLDVARVVTVAAPGDADLLLSQFQIMLGYGDPTAAALRRRFATRYFPDEVDPFARLSPLVRPVPAGIDVLAVHDEGDRVVPSGELVRIAAAHPAARALTLRGFGHNRILESDPFLDAVLEFVAAPPVASAAELRAGPGDRVDASA